MKKTFPILLSCLLAAGIASLALAGEEAESRHQVKLSLEGDDTLDVELDDLEVGESRQLFTEEGKEVVITRREEGLEIEVDGRVIDTGFGHTAIHAHAEGDTRVIVHKRKHGSDDPHVVFLGADGEKHEIGGDGHHVVWVDAGGGRGSHDTAGELEATGALDGLDTATRERILEELRRIDSERRVVVHKDVRVIQKDADEED